MNNILFVFPAYDESGVNLLGTKIHLGVSYISAFLASKGFRSTQHVMRMPATLLELAEDILNYQPKIVGFSTYDKNFHINRQIARKIKEKNKDVKIIFGGPTATFCDDLILQHIPWVELCVRGEGEQTVFELIQAWDSGERVDNIPGITFRTSGNKIKRNPDRTVLRSVEKGAELDIFPSPYLEEIIPIQQSGEIGLISSRGCPYKCVYCSNAAFARHRVSYHSVERVISELRMLDRMVNKREITFFDDAFTINLNRTKEICRQIIKEKFTNLSFGCLTRIDKCDEELFDLLKQSGFKHIAFGLESASPRLLRNIKKVRHTYKDENDFEPEKGFLSTMQRNIQTAKSLGFEVSVSIIVGLPGETPEDAKQTIEFVRQLDINYYSHNTMAVFSGTELAAICADFGMKIKHSPYLLPFQVEHAYDTALIAHLPISMTKRVGILENYKTSNHVKEILGAYRGETFVNYPRIVLLDEVSDINDSILEWLDNEIGLDTEILFKNEHTNCDEYNRKIARIADFGIPLIKYSQLRGVNEVQSGIRGYILNDVQYSSRGLGDMNYYQFSILPYSYDKKIERGSSKVFIREIKDLADLNSFEAEMAVIDANGGILLNQVGEKDFDILDKCRWSGCPCPGVNLSCVILSQKGEIRCCQHSPVLGNIKKDSLTGIKTHLAALLEETKKRRQCASCPVSEKCSQCLFLPGYISEEQYCNFRRERPWFSESIEAFEIARKILLQVHLKKITNLVSNKLEISSPNNRFFLNPGKNEARVNKVKDDIAIPRPLSRFFMIAISGNYFLYNRLAAKIIRMNEKMAVIFECLDDGSMRKDRLIEWISERYFLKKEEAAGILTGAIERFNSMNILIQ
jgi:radical SAM superfamily enzyme YgiQ (UPF0313 family)